ncbi:MAG: hypothetical protein IJR64_03335 [Bacteroidales bacterium]|nr:hypothetical protein [Bacteroidales bacterium]
MKHFLSLQAVCLTAACLWAATVPAQRLTAADCLGNAVCLGMGDLLFFPEEMRPPAGETRLPAGDAPSPVFQIDHLQATLRLPHGQRGLSRYSWQADGKCRQTGLQLHLGCSGPSTLAGQDLLLTASRSLSDKIAGSLGLGGQRLAVGRDSHWLWLMHCRMACRLDHLRTVYLHTFNLLPHSDYGFHCDCRIGMLRRVSSDLLAAGELEKQIGEPCLWRLGGEYHIIPDCFLLRLGARWPYPCLSAGLGYQTRRWGIDLGLSYQAELPLSLAGSLHYRLSRP